MKQPKIDPEFKSFMPVLSEDEFAFLEEKLLAEGCLKPLIVWKEENILLDGHNSLKIYLKHSIPFHVHEMKFPDRESALDWVVKNQFGRRNARPELKAYYIGKEYLATKKEPGRPKLAHSGTDIFPIPETDAAVAKKHGVSPTTVQRNAEFAKAVDAIEEAEGPEAKAAILNGKSGMTKPEVIAKAAGKPKKDRQPRKPKTKKDHKDAGQKALEAAIRACDTLGITNKKAGHGLTCHEHLQAVHTMMRTI